MDSGVIVSLHQRKVKGCIGICYLCKCASYSWGSGFPSEVHHED